MSDDLSFIVFADDWGQHPSSAQHLFRRIARAHRTLWVNTLGLRPPRLDRADAARVVRKLRGWVTPPTTHPTAPASAREDDGLRLHVVAPPMLPWMRPAPLRALNRASMRRVVAREAARQGLRDPVVLTTVPNGVDGEGIAGASTLVYYCVDDFTAWPGVDAQAATLYLQILALAEPTQKNVIVWNGWKPAEYKKAAEALAAKKLVVTGKRERAGREIFLPGGWEKRGGNDLPLESWKLALYAFPYGSIGRLLPPKPPHQLFADAWARVEKGDAPRYEEV